MSDEIVNFIRQRASHADLSLPAPSQEEWLKILDAASRAPDHGNLKPWRFRVYQGEGRRKIGELYWQHALAEVPDLSEEKKEAFIKKAYRAPSILLVYANVQTHPKVPDFEQVMATSAAAQLALLGLESLGYGGIWRTGPACFTSKAKVLLSLSEEDQLVGLIYAGTPNSANREVKDTQIENHLEWVTD